MEGNISILRLGKESSERVSSLPSVTCLVSGRARILTWNVQLRNPDHGAARAFNKWKLLLWTETKLSPEDAAFSVSRGKWRLLILSWPVYWKSQWEMRGQLSMTMSRQLLFRYWVISSWDSYHQAVTTTALPCSWPLPPSPSLNAWSSTPSHSLILGKFNTTCS